MATGVETDRSNDRFHRRFPFLSMEYYKERLLLAMGNVLGKAIKGDPHTKWASKGRFARGSLPQQTPTKMNFEGKWQPVEYEGLHFLCFSCGRSGHRGFCPFAPLRRTAGL